MAVGCPQGGVDVRPPDLREIVALTGDERCTGFLIAPDLVLTAAHCGNQPVVGVDRRALDSVGGREIRVIGRHIHPAWGPTARPGRVREDLQLLRLAEPAGAPFVRFASPADLAGRPALTVAGYGSLTSDGILRSLDELFVQTTGCRHGSPLLCVSGAFACGADSGGPLFLSSSASPRLIVAGVTSFGAGGGCLGPDDRTPDYYVNVTKFLDFIPVPLPRASYAAGTWGEPLATCEPDARRYNVPGSWETWQTADVDGDGYDDLLVRDQHGGGVDTFLNDRAGGFRPLRPELDDQPPIGADYDRPGAYRTLQTGFFNDDARADLLVRHPRRGLEIFLSDVRGAAGGWVASGFDPVRIDGRVLSDAAGWSIPERYETIQVGDVDGDGLSDIIARVPRGLVVNRNAGDGSWIVSDGPPLAEGYWRQPSHYRNILLADVAGDDFGFEGSQEIVTRDFCGLSVYKRNALDGWYRIRRPRCADDREFGDAFGWTAPDKYRTLQTADINGDACVDLVSRGANGPTDDLCAAPPCAHLRVWVSRCDGTFVEPSPLSVHLPDFYETHLSTPSYPGWDAEFYFSTLQMGDVNGDGFDDLVGRGPSGMLTWIGRGDGSFEPADPHNPPWADNFPTWGTVALGGWSRPEHYSTIGLADLDGPESPAVQLLGRNGCGGELFRFRN